MSGTSDLFIQPSQINFSALVGSGVWQRGIPTPGVPIAVPPVPAIAGLPDCRNLLSASPPTLLEAYEIYTYAIGFTVFASTAAKFTVELALLVNDRVRHITSQSVQSAPFGAAGVPAGAGAWPADLINAIGLGARDRLSLRVGLSADTAQAGPAPAGVVVGMQLGAGASPVAFESTISYRVLDVPAQRVL